MAESSRRAIPRPVIGALTVHANTESPVCFIMRLGEVRELAFHDRNGAYWLQPTAYDKDEFREAWHRIGVA